MAKKKKVVTRNPIAPVLRNPAFRSQRQRSPEEKAEQRDQWNKKAKHKKRDHHPDDFQIGDPVEYNEKEGMVKNPHGPLGLVGVTLDGEYELLPADELSLLESKIAELKQLSR